MHSAPRQLPDWLLGLLIAVVVATVVIVGAGLIGAGDDPSFATTSSTTEPGG